MKIQAANAQWRAILQAAAEGDLLFLQDAYKKTASTTRTKQEEKEEEDDDDEDAVLSLFETAVCSSGCFALHWVAGSCVCVKKAAQVIHFLVHDCGVDVNQRAKTKSLGRTALHYACRNGRVETARLLVERYGANPDAAAKAGVTPFQLAIWRNELQIAQWLVNDCLVDPCQTNDFMCGAMHWLGLCPPERAGGGGLVLGNEDDRLVATAQWLVEKCGLDCRARQRQGHNALHKAAWGGHLDLCRYLHERHGMWDDQPDDAGYYAVDLAEMAHKTKVSANQSGKNNHDPEGKKKNSNRHAQVASYLRRVCSRTTLESCLVLGITIKQANADSRVIRRAYHAAVRRCHPDKTRQRERQSTTCTAADNDISSEATLHNTGNKNSYDTAGPLNDENESQYGMSNDRFLRVTAAYRHLMQDDDDHQDHGENTDEGDEDGVKVNAGGSRRCYRNQQAIPFLLPPPPLQSPSLREGETTTNDRLCDSSAADDEAWLTQSRLRIVLQQHGRCGSGGGGGGGGGGDWDEKKPADDNRRSSSDRNTAATATGEGLDLSNLRKWWNRCWPDVPFPVALENNQKKKSNLKAWIKAQHAVVYMRRDDKGVTRLYLRE